MNEGWLEEWEDPDWGDDDETDIVACPACGADVYEEAEQCPRCGEYIETASTHPFAGRSLGFIGLGLLGIVAVIVVLVLFGF